METKGSFRRSDCRLCESKDLELVLSLRPSPIADAYVTAKQLDEVQKRYPLDLFLCHRCGHVQMLDVVDSDILFRDYTYMSSVSLGLVEHFNEYARVMVQRFGLSPGSLVVEMGSNDGSLLKVFKALGMRVLGIDPAVDIARKANGAGIETMPVFFSAELAQRIREERGSAALFAANNVFAHVDNLADICTGIHDLLGDEGIFVFEVAYLADLVEKNLFDTIYHEHLSYHTVKPLKSFFERNGMELIDVERISSKGGSLRGMAQVRGGGRKVSLSVSELIELESQLGFDRPETFKKFGTRIQGIKTELLDLLTNIKAQGKVIAGYGASAAVTTLISHLELGDILSFVVDDNPVKHNMFSPGDHIPVFSSQALYEKMPDCVVILAWQYAEPIMKKNQAYLDNGGYFIVPLPKVEVNKTAGG